MADYLTILPAEQNMHVVAEFAGIDGKSGYRRYKDHHLHLHRNGEQLQIMSTARADPKFTYENEAAFFAEWKRVRLYKE